MSQASASLSPRVFVDAETVSLMRKRTCIFEIQMLHAFMAK